MSEQLISNSQYSCFFHYFFPLSHSPSDCIKQGAVDSWHLNARYKQQRFLQDQRVFYSGVFQFRLIKSYYIMGKPLTYSPVMCLLLKQRFFSLFQCELCLHRKKGYKALPITLFLTHTVTQSHDLPHTFQTSLLLYENFVINHSCRKTVFPTP